MNHSAQDESEPSSKRSFTSLLDKVSRLGPIRKLIYRTVRVIAHFVPLTAFNVPAEPSDVTGQSVRFTGIKPIDELGLTHADLEPLAVLGSLDDGATVNITIARHANPTTDLSDLGYVVELDFVERFGDNNVGNELDRITINLVQVDERDGMENGTQDFEQVSVLREKNLVVDVFDQGAGSRNVAPGQSKVFAQNDFHFSPPLPSRYGFLRKTFCCCCLPPGIQSRRD